MSETKQYNAETLISDLEEYFARRYNDEQRTQIAVRLSTLKPMRLSGLYNRIIESCDRLPLLSKILEVSNRREVGDTSAQQYDNVGEHPWVRRAREARKRAEEHADWFMQAEPTGQRANAEGWGAYLRAFVRDWAEVQAQVIEKAEGFGISRSMLAEPHGSEDDKLRRDEMLRAVACAKADSRIFVPVPDWFAEWAKRTAEKARNAPPLPAAGSRAASIQIAQDAVAKFKAWKPTPAPAQQPQSNPIAPAPDELPPIEAYAKNLTAQQEGITNEHRGY